jgi:hypothetical protein
VNLKLEVTFASGKRSFLAISNENVDLEKWAKMGVFGEIPSKIV